MSRAVWTVVKTAASGFSKDDGNKQSRYAHHYGSGIKPDQYAVSRRIAAA